MVAAGTVVAAVAAVYAAVFTRRSADAAAKAAESAADQVDLQRPRPIVVVHFSRSLSENPPTMARLDPVFQLENIGDSPAFDVELSPMELSRPATACCKKTSPVDFLVPRARLSCAHSMEPPQGVLRALGPAATFVQELANHFNEQSKSEASWNPDHRYEMEFSLSYRGLDGRRFRQPYALVVYFPRLQAWVEPVGSLLEPASEQSTRHIPKRPAPRRTRGEPCH